MLVFDVALKIVLSRKTLRVIVAIYDWAKEARGTIRAVAAGHMPLEILLAIGTLECAAAIGTFEIS